MSRHVFIASQGGQRLDQVVAAGVPGLSRRRARTLIERGSVSIDGVRVRTMGRSLRPGVTVTVVDDELPTLSPTGQNAAPAIVFENDEVLVVNKPAGLATEPTRQAAASVSDALRGRYGKLHAVNRLDVDTSGLVVMARHGAAAAAWGEVFRTGVVRRSYIGVVDGVVAADDGVIDAALAPPDKSGRARVVAADDPHGKASTTVFHVLARSQTTTVLALFPQTGRTHQLRVHVAHIGHPLCGDRRYGVPSTTAHLGLHAIALEALVYGEKHHLVAPIPDALAELIVAVDAGLVHEQALTPGPDGRSRLITSDASGAV